MKFLITVLIIVCSCAVPVANEAPSVLPPERPLSFSSAKQIARNVIYHNHKKTLYCDCDFTDATSRSGGVIVPDHCKVSARKSQSRSKRLEWEHVVPISAIGQGLSCWKEGHADCITRSGNTYKGRRCCSKVDPSFKHAEGDLHNLAPSVGELNGDRSNHPYGLVEGEPRLYGACDFEVAGTPKIAEPPEHVKGNVARVSFYMRDLYDFELSPGQEKLFKAWSLADPVDDWECERDRRISSAQGNINPHVSHACKLRNAI